MSQRAACTSSACRRSPRLELRLHARELRPRMSSMGVGNRADMALASKLLIGAAPSCTCEQQRLHNSSSSENAAAGTILAIRLSSSGLLLATPQFSMLLSGCSIACAVASSSSVEAVAGTVRRRKMAEKVSQMTATSCGEGRGKVRAANNQRRLKSQTLRLTAKKRRSRTGARNRPLRVRMATI